LADDHWGFSILRLTRKVAGFRSLCN